MIDRRSSEMSWRGQSALFVLHPKPNTKPKNKTKRKERIMAIILEANYSKKLGLPGYSSHQFSVTLRTEVADLSQVEVASARLYALLQSSVDKEIQKVGYLPHNVNGNAA